MSQRFFEDPILNSPYECPTRHWELVDGIPSQEIVESRRESRLITPIPQPKKRGGKGEQAHQRALEIEAHFLGDALQQGGLSGAVLDDEEGDLGVQLQLLQVVDGGHGEGEVGGRCCRRGLHREGVDEVTDLTGRHVRIMRGCVWQIKAAGLPMWGELIRLGR